MATLNYTSENVDIWSELNTQLVISMHIFLAPNNLSGGARQFGAEHIYRGDFSSVVKCVKSVLFPLDILFMASLKETSLPFTEAFTI